MDASRLLAVLDGIEAEFTEGTAVLTRLIQGYTTARDTPAQDMSESIRQARSDLSTFFASSVTNSYTPSRRQLLAAIEAEQFVGNTAASHIDALLAEASLSPASGLTVLQAYAAQLSQFRGTCSQVRQGLAALHVESDTLVKDEAEVGILMPRTLTKGHLEALSRQLNSWNRILKGFTELAGADEREIAVRMLSTGSDQVFLVTTIAVAALIVPVIDKVMEWYKKILDIQKVRKELERLGAPVAEPEAVKVHEKKFVEDSIADLARELMSRASPSIQKSRSGELENQLIISIRHIARFVDQGGDVEVTVAPIPQEQFTPPTDASGVPLTPAEIEQRKAEWTASQQPRIQERDVLARKGAALASLPPRESPILQLPEADVQEPESPVEDGQKEDRRRKK